METLNVFLNIINKDHGNGNNIVDTFMYDNNVMSDPHKIEYELKKYLSKLVHH